MRLFIFVLFFLGFNFQSTQAQSSDVSASTIVGKWTTTDKLPNGVTVIANLNLGQNMKFTGVVTVEGNPFWEYAGTWSVEGRTLTWRYESSSRPLPESAKVDFDEIVTADSTKLVLLSKLSGKKHEYLRAQ